MTTVSQSNLGDGILPAHGIEFLIKNGGIGAYQPFSDGQIQPASLDLRLGRVAFRVRASFLPGPNCTVEDKLKALCLHEIDLSDGAVLETGCVYIVPLIENLKLPRSVSAAANPKSSTGRLDVFTRVITDYGQSFDTVSAGYEGPLYAEISPKTFSILVREGSTLSQIRFRSGNCQHSDEEMRALHEENTLVFSGNVDIDNGIALSVDLEGSGKGSLIGYRAKRHSGLIDLSRIGVYEIDDFWEPIINRGDSSLILDPDQFYILVSKEAVHVPPSHAAEMVPINPHVGEFRVHYAGFFDPGFGHSEAGGTGSRAVLEVRSHDVPFVLDDGQVIGRLIYERLTEIPDVIYGQNIGSNYQAQGLKLSKHFKV